MKSQFESRVNLRRPLKEQDLLFLCVLLSVRRKAAHQGVGVGSGLNVTNRQIAKQEERLKVSRDQTFTYTNILRSRLTKSYTLSV